MDENYKCIEKIPLCNADTFIILLQNLKEIGLFPIRNVK